MKRWLGVGALFIGLALAAMLHAGNHLPALYDGLPFPQEPYHYVSPPPDLASSNVQPSSGAFTFPIQGGQFQGGAQTDDAQVLAFFGLGSLSASPSAQTVTVRIDPVRNPPAPPPGSLIRGNVYRFSALEQPSGAAVVARSYQITMRIPPGAFKELQFYDGSQWHPLKTHRPAQGDLVAGATVTAFGEVAATAPVGAQGESIISLAARILEGYGLLAFIIVFGVIAVAQEVRRRRKRT